ncbi:MAG: aminotransferase class I/II-fold pyridoxal phosphate-dependent enzyme [Bryobacteraceae bacterium]
MTRRGFAARAGLAFAGGRMLPEMALAQRAALTGPMPKDMVWLNANENPDGPPQAAIDEMMRILPSTGRYHYQEFRDFYGTVAKSEDLSAEQILLGSGSSEVLHAAVDAFTSPTRPLIAIIPTYEGPLDLTRALGRTTVKVPLASRYSADVRKLAEEAGKADGGLIYMCNPNNPTSTITPKSDMAWLVANLPPNTQLLVDEAYHSFSESPEFESALGYVRQGKDVIVTRTFSKIYGMAGLRAGYACARPELISKMQPFRNNVISYVAARAVIAALADTPNFLPQRRAKVLKTRTELCGWLRQKGIKYIEPHANFLMIDIGRDVRPVQVDLARNGVAVGRPFPPLDTMMRVSIGSGQEMSKFRDAFWKVYNS